MVDFGDGHFVPSGVLIPELLPLHTHNYSTTSHRGVRTERKRETRGEGGMVEGGD